MYLIGGVLSVMHILYFIIFNFWSFRNFTFSQLE